MSAILIVCGKGKREQAERLFPGARVAVVGDAVITWGQRFDEIIVLDGATEGCSFRERQAAEQWLAEDLRMKLKPGGKLHVSGDYDLD